MEQARRWLFTLNNPHDDEKVHTFWQEWPHATAGVCQLEQGEQGTPHYQGYVQFDRPTRLAAVRRLLRRAHWEVARGTAADNKRYCTKDQGRLDGPWEFGTLQDQGKRNDWASLKESLDRGDDERTIAENHFRLFCQYKKGIDNYRALVADVRDWQTELVVICGPAGSGKSRLAWDLAGGPRVGYEYPGGNWFPDYRGQRCVVFDEFRGSHMPLSTFLKMCDRYPLTVETKGGFVNFVSHCVIVTSNILPEEWWPTMAEPKALFRRITHFVWLDHEENLCRYIANNYSPQMQITS